MVYVEASEGGEGKVFEGLGEEVVFEVEVVGVRADRAHDCIIDESLRIGVVGTCVHVRGNVGNVEGLAELMCVIVITLKRGMWGGVCRVTDGIDAWKDWGKDGIDVDVDVGLLVRGVARIMAAVGGSGYASLSG